MTEELRKQLLGMGIPATRHDAASLAGYFPREFKVAPIRTRPGVATAIEILHAIDVETRKAG